MWESEMNNTQQLHVHYARTNVAVRARSYTAHLSVSTQTQENAIQYNII